MGDSSELKKALEARKLLWKQGNLVWKLDDVQKEIYNLFTTTPHKIITITMSRRIGKTYTLAAIATMQCLQHPNSSVFFLLPELGMARRTVKPSMDEIFKDAPPSLRPAFKTQDNMYVFNNGSVIRLAGTDNGNEEKLRGSNAHLCIIDEAAFVNADLEYIVQSILLPSTTLTKGKLIISSTPPKEANHPYNDYVERAKLEGSYLCKNVYDAIADESNPRFTKETIAEITIGYPNGGEKDPNFLREYGCIFTIDGENRVVPEFTPELKDLVVTEWQKPTHYHGYVGMDIGFRDLTVALFAYMDYYNGVLVIDDELVINGPEMTTEKLAQSIVEKEDILYTNPYTGELNEPYERVADNNLIVINDLDRLYGIRFYPAEKSNRDAAIAEMRTRLEQRQIIINPRCKHLISHLEKATWDKNRKNFTRSADNGHYDAIPALYMLLRIPNIWQRNPYPANYKFNNFGNGDTFIKTARKNEDKGDLAKLLTKQFTRKSTLKR